jgi:putative ABC transport system ATP-binding protein
MIRAEDISKSYFLGETRVQALAHVTLEIPKEAFVAIAGPSGSGKSTLLNILGAIERPTEGRVLYEGRDVTDLQASALARLRATTVGFVFQTFNLLPVLTAFENVEYPLQLQGAPKRARVERVKALLAAVGLEKFGDHRPRQLSGGQRQRVAVARALAGNPSLVLADEPTANLDEKTGTEIIALMKAIAREHHTTLVFSTHDARIMAQADRVVTLAHGSIVSEAPPVL